MGFSLVMRLIYLEYNIISQKSNVKTNCYILRPFCQSERPYFLANSKPGRYFCMGLTRILL